MYLNLKKTDFSMSSRWVVLPVLLAVFSLNSPSSLAEMTSEKLYQLCSSFPYNSKCEGYSAPISLEDRPGKAARCVWGTGDAEQGGDCKFVLTEDSIVAYIEEGEPLQVLGDRRSTREVSLGYELMEQLQYREFKQGNNGARAVNTLLFGAIGFFATRNKPVAEVTVQYQPQASSVEPLEAVELPPLERFSFIVERDLGTSVRTHLESQTNLKVGVPEDELPFVEDSGASETSEADAS